jgi:aminoglycoside phosphotransferase (APT) family kinase protein
LQPFINCLKDIITLELSLRQARRTKSRKLRKIKVGIQKMHVDEMDTDESLVRRLIDTQFPQWSHLPIKAVNSAGTDNALYRLGDEMVVRLPRVQSASRQIDKEHQWLPKLAPHLPLLIPHPLMVGMPAEGYPWRWSVYQWLEGQDASLTPIMDERQAVIALAEFLRALHRVDPTGGPFPGEHNFFRGVPLAMRDARTRAAIAALHSLFDGDLMTEVWNCSLETSVWSDPPCWIHGDLIPTNLLVQNGHLTAVIDFGGLGVGDPACDLLVAWTFLSAEARNIFRSALLADDATWTRGRGWALSFGLIAFDFYQKTNPTLARIAKQAIEEVLADYKIERKS